MRFWRVNFYQRSFRDGASAPDPESRSKHGVRFWIPGSLASLAPRNDRESKFFARRGRLYAGHPRLPCFKTWMPATSAGMTVNETKRDREAIV